MTGNDKILNCQNILFYDSKKSSRRRLAMSFLLGLLIFSNGCGRSGAEPDTAKSPSAVTTAEADAVLQAMLAAYRDAKAYADQGIVRLRYRESGQWVHDDGKFSVTFERPNRLLLRAYQLTLASDGDNLYAVIADPATDDLDRQVKMVSSPPRLDLDLLYSDPMIRDLIGRGMGGPPVQLELLLSDQPLQHLMAPNVSRELLSPDSVSGHVCDRIHITLDEGQLTLWIDRDEHLLRRLEYPVTTLAKQMQQDPRISEVSLTAEFRNARFVTEIERTEFAFPIRQGARLVRQFVLPPQPLACELYGRAPENFYFTNLQSERVDFPAGDGRVRVLAWFNDHPACRMTLQQLEAVRQSFRETDEAVEFYAVSTEPSHVTGQELQNLAKRWEIAMPIVRDLQAFGRDVFHIPWAPTLVVLDRNGVVQLFEVGGNPELAQRLPEVLQRIIAGEDLAAEVIGQFERERSAYEKALLENALQPGRILR